MYRFRLERSSLNLSMVKGVINIIKHEDTWELDNLDVFSFCWIFLSW